MKNLDELTTQFDYIGVEDITDFLARFTGADKSETGDALYYLQTCAQNPLNKDYFRTLYKSLIVATGLLTARYSVNHALMYADDVINEYVNNADFDPLRVLTGDETRADKLFHACCNLTDDIKNALDKFEKAKKDCL